MTKVNAGDKYISIETSTGKYLVAFNNRFFKGREKFASMSEAIFAKLSKVTHLAFLFPLTKKEKCGIMQILHGKSIPSIRKPQKVR